MAKSFDDIDDGFIDNAELLWLNVYISTLRYLEEGASRFTELSTKDMGEEENEESQFSDSKKEKNKKKILWKEKRESWVAACVATFCFSAHGSLKPGSPAAMPGQSDSSASAPPPSVSSLSSFFSSAPPLSTPSAPSPSVPSNSFASTPPLSTPFASPPSTPPLSVPSTLFTLPPSAPSTPSVSSALSTLLTFSVFALL